MTVCIAAICDNGQRIVVAADRMLTFMSPLNLEFETEEKKIEQLANGCVALASGNTAYATEILQAVKQKIGGNATPEFQAVAEAMKGDYAATKMRKAYETIILHHLGLDFDSFQKKGGTLPAYLKPQAQTFQQMIALSGQFNLQVDILLAGIDDVGAHLCLVTHPGTLLSLERQSYSAIGSGGIHATIYLSLSAHTSHKGLLETVWNVFAAKKAAEVAPGVGRGTDLVVVEKTSVKYCAAPTMSILESTFEGSNKRLMPDLTKLKETYERDTGS
jgi:hypothetical protein